MTSNDVQSVAVGDVDKVVIIGTGFVGLPLALMLAANGKEVVGVDIDQNVVDAINDGSLNLDEDELESLLQDDTVDANLHAATNPTDGDAFVVSVPTPLEQPAKSPDLSYVEAAIESILPHLESGDIINVESTIPPLTCDQTIVPMLEAAGFKPGEDIHLAHSPERILPGNVFDEIVENDRVIGGVNEESARRAAAIYEPFLQGDVYTTTLLSAELCKLMENTYRDVNVGLANEFALIGNELDVEIDEVISLANHHPRVEILTPGIGVGGHCLPVDPWFLNEADPEHTNLITTARRINDMMPEETAKAIRRAVSRYTAPSLLVLGASYKPNTYDQRNSPAKEVVESLMLDGYDVNHYDRHVDGMKYENIRSLVETENPDVVIQLVSHDETLKQLERNEAWLNDRDIELLQVGVGNPLSVSR